MRWPPSAARTRGTPCSTRARTPRSSAPTTGATCADRRTCGQHWRYLIANDGPVLHLQCPGCTHTWSLDTRPARPV
ncbi:hypothetical protein [Streptomyces parvus]|uniref:hypothetical protein n=1 Tax=Streptomyces parvus TaxID=66428 RepID=UPI00370970DF